MRQEDPTGRRLAFITPLFLALLVIEVADVIFIADMLGRAKSPTKWSLGITFAILGGGAYGFLGTS